MMCVYGRIIVQIANIVTQLTLYLLPHANLFVDYPDGGDHVTVKIDKFFRDRTGLVHLRPPNAVC